MNWRTSLLLLGLMHACSGALADTRRVDLSDLAPAIQESLYKQIPALKSGEFKKSDLDAAIRQLVGQELFDAVEIHELNPDLFKVTVSKTKRLTQIQFKGLESISETEVRREFALNEKTPFDQQTLIDAGERVRKLYNERAFLNAIVDLEYASLSSTDMAVTVRVKEGLQTLISGVDVQCANSELRERVEKLLRKKNNEPLLERNLAEMRKTVKDFFGEKRYLKSDLQGPQIELSKDESRAHLLFTIDKADKFRILFTGNTKLSDRELENALDLDNFFTSNPNAGPELATKIKNYYLAEGYARVLVTSEETATSENYSTDIQIDITEGPRVKIKEISFSGRFSLSGEEYQKILLANSAPLIQKGYYNRDDLETGFKNLVIDRQNQGYLKAKVVSSRAVYNKEKDQISVLINFDEGPMTLVQGIGFVGNSSYSEPELKAILGLEVGRPLKLSALDEALQRLKTFYRNNGFLEMSLLNEHDDLVNYNSENTLVNLKFKIYEGPKIVVGSIVIDGNNITKEYVIMKELEFKVGDVLTPQSLEESTSRLQRLGHFSSVDIRTQEEKTQVARRTIIVRVTDREPGLFNMGIGLSNERQLTLRGFLGIAYRNIGGTGRGASARIDGNYNIADIQYLERRATVGYLEPYLLDTRTRGRVNFTQSNMISPTNENNGVETRQFAFSIEQDITSHVLVSFDLWNKATYRNYILKTNDELPDAKDPSKADPNSRVEIAFVGPTVDIDFRDHPFNPTTGTFTRFNLEYASPAIGSSATIEYLRSIAGFTHYLPVNKAKTWVWANSVRFGYLKNMSGRADGGVPYDKKGLIFGGQSTIRGFNPGEAFPNSADFNTATGLQETIPLLRTEAKSYLLKSELRFPIHNNFGGALFYDGGAVLIQNVDLPDPYRDSAGLAVRYSTPVGAVSLEWGFKLDRHTDRDESWYQFHFSIGTF